jgi:hypothetical protein
LTDSIAVAYHSDINISGKARTPNVRPPLARRACEQRRLSARIAVRHPNKERVVVMRQRLRTYTGYGIGCVIAWAIILPAVAVLDSKDILHIVLVLCGGWWIGWISATIARAVYPPSARWRERPAGSQAG